jgi:hypothetical protein
MTDLIHRIYSEDGTFIDREFTAAEIKIYEENKKAIEFEKAAIQTAKDSATSKLAALGLTLDDLKVLGF